MSVPNNMSEKLATIEEGPKTKPEQEVVFEEVAELEEPIKRIIEQILPRIERGEYGLIIGDDASGRIPTLILGNFIKTISEQRGLSKPEILFIPGKLRSRILGRDNDRKELEEHISRFGSSIDNRVLIVTDTVLTGESLKTLVAMLRKIGFTCDIATIGVEADEESIEDISQRLQNSEIISGEYYTENSLMPNTPKIYREKTLSGVTKKRGQTKSTTLKSTESNEEEKAMIQDQINQAREDAGVVTKHLIEWYETLENEK